MRIAARLLALLVLSLSGVPARGAIVINEIMYNSPGSPDVEYVELYNTGPVAQDLTGWYLLDDDGSHVPCLLSGALAAGGFLVVVGDATSFSVSYPGVLGINPDAFGDGFGLGNEADQVRLFNGTGQLVDVVSYTQSAPWPPEADGDGPSLELLNPALDNSVASSWAASSNGPPGGTPGSVNSRYLDDPAPNVADTRRSVPLPKSTDSVTITTRVTDDQASLTVELWADLGSGLAPQPMLDDGLHGDGAAQDGTYGTTLPPRPAGTVVRYHVAATDSLPQTATDPPLAPAAYFAYTVDHVPPVLRVNEMVALNQGGLLDPFGQSDDWIEIRNPGPFSVSLGGMILTDDFSDTRKWALPAVTLPPGAFLMIWCDGEPGQGTLHTSFRLAAAAGEIGLFESVDRGNVLIHGFTYGPQSANVSFGYRPDDSERPEYLASPTPATSNDAAALFSPVCINEIFTASSLGGAPDWIELYNRGVTVADVGGWHLSDSATEPQRFTFPIGTLIAPGAYLSIDETSLGFGFDAGGDDEVVLTRTGGAVGQDYLDYGPQPSNTSHGRLPDGTPSWHQFAPSSRDLPNACDPGVTPLGAVLGLRFESKSALRWDGLPGATSYDVIRGDLTLLRTAGSVGASLTACPENNSLDALAWAPHAPAGGEGIFFLVRGVNGSCRFGTYDSGGPSQVGSRDDDHDPALTCP